MTKDMDAATRRLTQKMMGELVWDALAEVQPDGLSWDGIAAKIDEATWTRPSKHQVKKGIEYVRHVLASLEGEPIVYKPEENIYILGASQEQTDAYMDYRGRIFLVQLQGLLKGTVEPALSSYGDSLRMLLARRQTERLINDLEDLIEGPAA